MARDRDAVEVYRSGESYLATDGRLALYWATADAATPPPAPLAAVQAHAMVSEPWSAIPIGDCPAAIAEAARSLRDAEHEPPDAVAKPWG